MIITIPSEKVEATNEISLHLRGQCIGQTRIPINYDITGIKLSDVNENIQEIYIMIGGQVVLRYAKKDFDNIVLPDGGLLLSKCVYHTTYIVVKYDKKYIEANTQYEVREEEIEEDIVEDEEVTFLGADGEYHTGRRVYRVKRSTGKKISTAVGYNLINTPTIELAVQESIVQQESHKTPIMTPFWVKIVINPVVCDEKEFEYLKTKYNFVPDDTTIDIDTEYKNNCIITGKVRNNIVYNWSMASLETTFSQYLYPHE
jgi:hypothetical protein